MGGDFPVLQVGQKFSQRADNQPDAETTRIFDSTHPSVVQVVTDRGLGSGFFINQSGDVVTDAHCVLDSNWQDVILSTGRRVQAKVTKVDDIHDLALLHIDGLNTLTQPFLPLGSSQTLASGTGVWALLVRHP
jgi:S1-C subfamily serine protease